MNRDQKRALDTFERVRQVHVGQLSDYRIAAQGLVVNLIRSGLAASMADLLRTAARPGSAQFAKDLCGSLPEHLRPTGEANMLRWAAELPTDRYMLATREVLRLSVWFKRALQGRA